MIAHPLWFQHLWIHRDWLCSIIVVTYTQSSSKRYLDYKSFQWLVLAIVSNQINRRSRQQNAFMNCFNLTFIFFTPQSRLHHVDGYALHSCDKLRFTNTPSTIISIDNEAFYRCDALSTTNYPLHLFKNRFRHLPLRGLLHKMHFFDSIESNTPRLI